MTGLMFLGLLATSTLPFYMGQNNLLGQDAWELVDADGESESEKPLEEKDLKEDEIQPYSIVELADITSNLKFWEIKSIRITHYLDIPNPPPDFFVLSI